jgi:hypothetical protein
MREGESVVKHIQSFQSLLKQLTIVSAPITNDDVILSLMQNMPLSYRTFRTSMRRQPTITLQSLITYLLQEKGILKNLTHTIHSMLTLYVGKGPYYPKGSTQIIGPPFLQQSFKSKDNFNPSTRNNRRFEPPRKFGVSNVRKWIMEFNIVEYILLKTRQITCNPI